MNRPTPTTDADERVILQHPDALARAVIRALAVAGAQTDWDAETVELVLEPLNDYAVRLGLPTATDYSADNGRAVRHWRRVADELGIDHDGSYVADELADDELEETDDGELVPNVAGLDRIVQDDDNGLAATYGLTVAEARAELADRERAQTEARA